jgi:glycerol-3-phosphate dehydrogenase
MALTLSDAVLRRLDLGTAGPPPPADLDTVARVLATEWGWDEGRVASERADLTAFYAR